MKPKLKVGDRVVTTGFWTDPINIGIKGVITGISDITLFARFL